MELAVANDLRCINLRYFQLSALVIMCRIISAYFVTGRVLSNGYSFSFKMCAVKFFDDPQGHFIRLNGN